MEKIKPANVAVAVGIAGSTPASWASTMIVAKAVTSPSQQSPSRQLTDGRCSKHQTRAMGCAGYVELRMADAGQPPCDGLYIDRAGERGDHAVVLKAP